MGHAPPQNSEGQRISKGIAYHLPSAEDSVKQAEEGNEKREDLPLSPPTICEYPPAQWDNAIPNTPPASDFTLEDVFRAWPRFLQAARRVSKVTEVMMASAMPVGVVSNTIEIEFPDRMRFDLMNVPKNQELVRQLFIRCLNSPKVGIRFSLSASATPAPTRQREKQKPVVDPLAALDALDREAGLPPASESDWRPPAPSRRDEVAALPTPPPRLSAPPTNFATAPRYHEPPRATAPPAVASERKPKPSHSQASVPALAEAEELPETLSEFARNVMALPLVQDILEIFGGEIVTD